MASPCSTSTWVNKPSNQRVVKACHICHWSDITQLESCGKIKIMSTIIRLACVQIWMMIVVWSDDCFVFLKWFTHFIHCFFADQKEFNLNGLLLGHQSHHRVTCRVWWQRKSILHLNQSPVCGDKDSWSFCNFYTVPHICQKNKQLFYLW